MDNLESARLRWEKASQELIERLVLQDEIEAIQNWEDVWRKNLEKTAFQWIERVAEERWRIWDMIQSIIDAWELPEKSHRLQKRRDIQIEIIALARLISARNRTKSIDKRVRATWSLWINVRDVNSQVDVLVKLRKRKEVKEKISFRFKSKNIVIFFGEKIRVEVDWNTQESLWELPIKIIILIRQYNSL